MASLVAMDKLRAVVEEFLTTERKYVQTLTSLNRVFMPMYAEFGAMRVSHDVNKTFQDMFSSWNQLLEFHKSLLLTIEARCLVGGDSNSSHITEKGAISIVAVADGNGAAQVHKQTQDGMDLRLKKTAARGLANVMKSLGHYLKMYSIYSMHYRTVLARIKEAREEDEEFDSMLKRFASHPVANGLDISSILIQPIQRLCKYELFLRDMGKQAGKTDDTGLQTDIVMALQITKQAVEKVNQNDKDKENLARVRKLQRELRPANKVDLFKAHIRLVLEGNAMAVEIPPQIDHMADPFNIAPIDHLIPPRLPNLSETSSDSDALLHAPLSTSSAEPVHIFLLTDLLIICRYKLKKKGALRRQDKHRYHIAQLIRLQTARVSVLDLLNDGLVEKGLGSHALKIEWDMHKEGAAWFALSLPSFADSEHWFQEIENCISKSQQKHSVSGNANNDSEIDFDARDATSGVNAHDTANDASQQSVKQGNVHQTVQCFKCKENLIVPDGDHVMSCHFCKQLFLFERGRPVGKPIFQDGPLERLTSRRFSFGSSSKTRYFVLTKSALGYYKTLDAFLSKGESGRKGAICINSTTTANANNKAGDATFGFEVQTKLEGSGGSTQREILLASSQSDRKSWISSIRFVVKHYHTSGYQPVTSPTRVSTGNSQNMSVVSAPVVIPPGVDEDVFLSLPLDVQEEVLRESGCMQKEKN